MIDNDEDFGPPGISVFTMYQRNGGDAGLVDRGLWIRGSRWPRRVCRVAAVAGGDRGCRPGAPDAVAFVEFYDLATGRLATAARPLAGVCLAAAKQDYRRMDPPWFASSCAPIPVDLELVGA